MAAAAAAAATTTPAVALSSDSAGQLAALFCPLSFFLSFFLPDSPSLRRLVATPFIRVVPPSRFDRGRETTTEEARRVGFASPLPSILLCQRSRFLRPSWCSWMQTTSQEIRVLLGNGSTNLAGNRSVDRVVSTAPDQIRVHADPRRIFSRWIAYRLSVKPSLDENTLEACSSSNTGISNAT